MIRKSQNRLWWVVVGIVLLSPSALGQLQIGDNTTLKANATAGLGWTGTYDGNDINSLTYGFNGNVTGDYYDERFLNWTITPYFNQSKLNSNFNSTSSASGVNALANFLSNSRTPVQFTYAFDHNAEGTFNVPGSAGSFRTAGSGQAIGVNASYLPEDWPSIQGVFTHSSSNYDVLGGFGGGTANGTGFGFSSAYNLWDTNLNGSYSRSYNSSESPAFSQSGETVKSSSNQGTLQFAASRRLASWSNGSFSFARTSMVADYAKARTEGTFDTVGGLLSAQATKRLAFNFHANYSSNLSEQFLAAVLSGNNAGATNTEVKGPSVTSSYLNYGVTSGYNITRELTATGGINRQVQGQPGLPDAVSTIMNVGASWSHRLLGGSLGAHYGIAYYFAPVIVRSNNENQTRDSTFTGHNAAVSYGRSFLGFSANGSLSYGRSLTYLLIGYVQSNYAANGSLSRNIASWNFAVSTSYSKAHIETMTLADSSTESYSASISHRGLGLNGNYSRSNGEGLQVGNNIIPNPTGGPFPPLLFKGESYGGGISYRPLRRWMITSSYAKLKYNSIQADQSANNTSEQFFLRSEYHFRQMNFNFGYSHLMQGFGIGTVRPTTIDTVFFGVTRRFDIF